jgi:hypothetical protein
VGDVLPPEYHLTLVRFDSTGNQVKKSGFACPIRPDDAPKFSRLKSKVHVVDGLETTKTLTEILYFQSCRHHMSLLPGAEY